MNIYLLDFNINMVNAWNHYFRTENVEAVHSDFASFIRSRPDVEAIVSPANSFGLMDGGYDKAIIDYFGSDLMDKVQGEIISKWYGEQPVGTSMSVPIDGASCKILIHTPTMRTPERIVDHRVVYQCMRTTLIEALNQKVNSIVIPAFGALTGGVPCGEVAEKMFLAYKQVFSRPNKIDWEYAKSISIQMK